MRRLNELIKILIIDFVRSPFDFMLTFLLPVMIYAILSTSTAGMYEPSFQANFKLPSWVRTSKNPDAVLTLKGNKLLVKIKSSDPSKIAIIKGKVWKIKSFLEESKPVFRIELINVSWYSEHLYSFSGLLALIVMAAGMTAAVRYFSLYREKGLLKLIGSLPLNKIHIFVFPISSLIVSIIGAFALLLMEYVFRRTFHITPLLAAGILISFLIAYALGLLIAIFIKSSKAAMGFASMFYIISPFLSGMYFPVKFLHPSLRAVSPFLPSTWIAKIIRWSLGI